MPVIPGLSRKHRIRALWNCVEKALHFFPFYVILMLV